MCQQQVFDWACELLEQQPLLAGKIVQRCEDVSRDAVLDGVNEMLRFLWLCSSSSQVLTPSARIDQIWHEFILFTRVYQQFCQTRLGRFIHHQPSAQPSAEAQQYRATLSLYQRHYGQPDAAFWPQPNKQSLPCGACETE